MGVGSLPADWEPSSNDVRSWHHTLPTATMEEMTQPVCDGGDRVGEAATTEGTPHK